MKPVMTARRQGYSLIEMLAVMAVFTMVLTVGATLLALLFRLNDAARLHTDGLQMTDRLARVLRADVRAARGANFQSGRAVDHVTLAYDGGRTVHYEVLPRALKRTVMIGSQQMSVERFRMYRGSPCFDHAEAGGHTWITLAFDHHAEPRGDNRPHALLLRAPLGADHRYEEARP